MNLDKTEVANIGGQSVHRISMENDSGMRVSILTYGATVTSLLVPDGAGQNGIFGRASAE